MQAPPLVCTVPPLGLILDVRRMGFDEKAVTALTPSFQRAFDAMDSLESGSIANPDEGRQVGHYWLRAPERAPSAAIRADIENTVAKIKEFVAAVHAGKIATDAGRFTDVLVVGIGGSALGPQLVSRGLGTANDAMEVHFLDNTDPDGMDLVLDGLAPRFATTLVIVISKSGGTKETRNGMLEVKWAMEKKGIAFAPRTVAITGEGSALDRVAVSEKWLARFPMWDWVGGRTSELSAVGLLPAALQGLDIDAMLTGARLADEATRVHDVLRNPAALLAASWWIIGEGRGAKDMVLLPYRDRLELFSRYLQQLVMESLGKEKDLDGKVVHQGIAVYGNKGSTDQHAYVQQLREGVPNFFVTFIQVLKDRAPGRGSSDVEPGVTSGDFLFGFLLGTRRALQEAGRPSLTLTIETMDARALGALIALFERAVGLYAVLINVNAYHQPGVEAGKKAAGDVIALQGKLLTTLRQNAGFHSVDELAKLVGTTDVDTVSALCQHLAANGRGVQLQGSVCEPWAARYAAS